MNDARQPPPIPAAWTAIARTAPPNPPRAAWTAAASEGDADADQPRRSVQAHRHSEPRQRAAIRRRFLTSSTGAAKRKIPWTPNVVLMV
jgi:hypothetical protein